MIIYVIHEQKLFNMTLPLKINGSYSLTDIFNNKERNLINIVEENGNWVAYSNKHVKIWQDKKQLGSVILQNYQYLLLQVKGQEGFLVMYTCPVNDSSFVGVKVPGNMEFIVGSGGDNAISCNNPLIGHKHAKITYLNGNWKLEDLSTQYGTFVNNRLIQGEVNLFHGDVIFILGLKLIVLADEIYFNNPLGSVRYNNKLFANIDKREELPKFEVNEDDNEVELYDEADYFIRSPRFMETVEAKKFILDQHPVINEPEETPLLLTMGPMLTMGTSSVVMLASSYMSYQNGGSASSILPTAAISVSMLAGTLLWPTLNSRYSKKIQKKKLKELNDKYSTYLNKKNSELDEISTMQKQILLSNNISPQECYKLIVTKSRSLWSRELHQNDFLTLRLGIGDVPLKINYQYPEEHFQLKDDQLLKNMTDILERHKYISGAPILENFTKKNIFTVTGKYNSIKPYSDLLILQMLAFHSYFDLKIVIFTNKEKKDYWNYLKKVPHLFSNDRQIRFFSSDFDSGKEISGYLSSIFVQREEMYKKNNRNSNEVANYKLFSSYYMIITDNYEEIKDYPIIDNVLHMNGNYGFSLMILNESLANLPTQCKSFIGIDNLTSGGIFENEIKNDTRRQFKVELLNQADLNLIGTYLSNIPMKNKDEVFALPKSFSFLEMYDAGNIEQLNILEKWKNNNPINSLAAPIGISTSGNLFKLDLHEKEQGPHGLIAGMTGSGKSEFIITYILSMAVNYHPDEVQFVLIDYKGGGLVGAFLNKENGIKLPHLAGTITNLEVADINRALASIESELKRRQNLFNIAREKINEGTIDIYKYQKYYREGILDTPLSHLFIISDEFAELKSQQPEFMDQLISTARIGRSLGVHLILATQKPSGVVNDQIWSNTRFRVCLKVQDAGDSNEVIKRPDAASLKEVGRFYLQVGFNEFFALGQAAYAGAPYIAQDKVYHEVDDKINFINEIGKSFKTIGTPRNLGLAKGEQLSNIVQYISNLAEKENIHIKQLWLEKIPAIIYLDSIKKEYHYVKKNHCIESVVGLYDNPSLQEQGLVTVDLTNRGNAIIYSMEEKNTFINTLIYSLITTYQTNELNLYIIDCDTQTLKLYEAAPQVGDVMFDNEEEKINNLFKFLNSEIEKRKVLFQEYNGSWDYYCSHSGKTIPAITLILHGVENFRETYEDFDTIFNKISREGNKYGIYVIATAISDRALRISARSNFTQIIPLKLNSDIDYNMLLGKKPPVISDIDGRGVILMDDNVYEFQTAVICDIEKTNEYLKNVFTILNQQLVEKAPKIKILPEHVLWRDILENQMISLERFPVGIVCDNLSVATYNFKKSAINLFNASNIDALSRYVLTLIHQMKKISGFDTIVVDERKIFSEYETTDYEHLNAIIFNRERNKDLIIFMSGIEKWISALPINIKNNIGDWFNKINDLNNCYFVFIDRIEDIKSLMYEKWFKQLVLNDYGLYVGKGITNNTFYSLTNSMRSLSSPIADNFGYLIINGTAIKIKLVEEEKNNE